NAVNGHRFASTNPSCAAVRLAPNVVLPSTVSTVVDPRHAGRVAFSEAKASARPKPDTLSGDEPLSGIARPRIKSRTVLRAPAGPEQTAPTAITATGGPPASPWAETLRVAVL